MQRKRVRGSKKPETILQEKIAAYLRNKGWYVKSTHGNEYQSGFPDLYCIHRNYGTRWVEVKIKEKYKFTPAQLDTFPMFQAHGVGVWILVDANDFEYRKLFSRPNWTTYLPELKPRARNAR